MNEVMSDLAEMHKKNYRYDIDISKVEPDKDYIVYNDLIFEDGSDLFDYIHENESDDFDTIEELENYCDSIDSEIKTGAEILKEEGMLEA